MVRHHLPRLLCSALLVANVAVSGCRSNEANPTAVERELAQKVPLNSSPAQVIGFLNQQKIEHSAYERSSNQLPVIEAVIREPASRWTIVKTDFGVHFTFDAGGHLTSIRVTPRYTGP